MQRWSERVKLREHARETCFLFFCILCVPSGLTLLKFGIEIGKKRRKRREGAGWDGRKGNEQ